MNEDDRGIGDNGGPPLTKFTAKQKLERIKQVLEMEITSAQKCVGIGIVIEADADGIAKEIPTKQLQTFASVSDRETVYRATKVLEDESVARPIKVKGKPNSYQVLPPKVVDAVMEAYHQLKANKEGGRLKPDGTTTPHPVGLDPTTGVRSNPTRPAEPVGSEPTGQVGTDTPPPSPSRARVLDNNIINTNNYPMEDKDRGLGGKDDQTDELPISTPQIALEAFNLYNAVALQIGLPQARTLTPQRRKQLQARLREHGGIDAWKIALANVERSAFLRGDNDRGWQANFDFMLQASSFTKLVEGTYGNGAHAKTKGDQQPQESKHAKRQAMVDAAFETMEREKKGLHRS